jgi:hypothetical protein
MNDGRGVGRGRAFVLAARVAASRLVRSGGRARRQRKLWTPAPLRWRRRRMLHTRERAYRQGITAQNLWRLEFHLHFTSQPAERSGGSRSAARPSVSRSPGASPISTRPAEYVARTATPKLPQPRAGRVPSPRPVGTPAVLNRCFGVAVAFHRHPAPRPAPSGHAGEVHRVRVPAHRRPAVVRPGPMAYAPTRPDVPSARTHTIELLVRHRHSPLVNDAPAPRRVSAASHLVWNRLPELVWTRSQGQTAAAAAPEPGADLSSHTARLSPPSRSVHGTMPHPAITQARVPTAPITTLDPALVDRLADDVIRRVERRVRIERERRGI